MSWIIYIFLSIILFTTMQLLSRVLSVKSKNVRAFTVVFNLISAGFALLIFLASGGIKNFHLPTNYFAYLFLFGGVIAYGLFERLRFKASKLVEASLLSLFSPISLVTAFIISSLIYQENLTLTKIISLVLIFVAIVMVTYNKKVKNLTKEGIKVAVATSVIVGIAMSFDKAGASNFNSETYSIFLWLLPLIIIYFFPRVKTKDILDEAKLANWKILVLSISNVVAYYLMLKAFALADATKVILISELTMILTVIGGIIFLKERKNVWVKILASLLAFAGVTLLVI